MQDFLWDLQRVPQGHSGVWEPKDMGCIYTEELSHGLTCAQPTSHSGREERFIEVKTKLTAFTGGLVPVLALDSF